MRKKEAQPVPSSKLDNRFRQIVDNAIKEKKTREAEIPFSEYLEKVAKGETTRPKNAYELIHAAILEKGERELPSGYKEYPFFCERTDEYAVYGLHRTINEVVDVIKTGNETGGKKKGLLLVGESGVGKSIIVEAVKRGLVEHVTGISKPIYAVNGCPIQEDPLNLLHQFLKVEERKKLDEKDGIKICEPCPECQRKLKQEQYDLEKMTVVPYELSLALGKGVSKIDPKLTKEKKDKGSVVDKQILKSNRAILELSELFQHDIPFLTSINDLIRGRTMPQDGEQYRLDTVIVAHTTSEEYEKFKDKPELKSLLARFDIVRISFNISSKAESKIYRKTLRESNFKYHGEVKNKQEGSMHIPERTFEVFGEYAVLSRFRKNSDISPTLKLHLYNGESVKGVSADKAKDIEKNEAENGEGKKGLSPADAEEMLKLTATKAKDVGCLNPFTALARLRELNQDSNRIEHFAIIQEQNERWLVENIRRSFRPDYEEAREELYKKYMTISRNVLLKETTINKITEEIERPDWEFLNDIESKGLGNELSKTDGLEAKNKENLSYASIVRKGKTPTFEDASDWLKRGIDQSLFGSVEEMKAVIDNALVPESVLIKSKDVEDSIRKRRKKFIEVRSTLVEKYGFCPHCVVNLLLEASRKNLIEKYAKS